MGELGNIFFDVFENNFIKFGNQSMDVWENLETSVLKVSQIFVNVFIILWKPWEIYHLIIVSVVNNNDYIVPLQYIFIHNL